MEVIQKEMATGSLGLRKPFRSAIGAPTKVVADTEDILDSVWGLMGKVGNRSEGCN